MVRGICPKWLSLKFIHMRAMMRLASLAMRGAIQDDNVAMIKGNIAKMDDALADGNTGTLFKITSSLMPSKYSKGKKACRVIGKNGAPAGSLAEEKCLFKEHFTWLLNGMSCSFEELVDIDLAAVESALEISPDTLNILDFPSLLDLADQFAKRNPSKAFGENLLNGSLYKRFPFLLACIYYPLVFKIHARIRPPIQWKGGMITELFKKGESSCITNYRDIMLADDSGKAVAKLIRHNFMGVALGFISNTQFGSGFNGGETAFGHLHVRLFLDSRKALGISGAVVFLDVVSAFAMLLRKIVFQVEDGDEAWLASLKQAGFPESEIKNIYEHINSIPWISNNQGVFVSNHSTALAQQFYTNTWFTSESTVGVSTSCRGSAAGTPLADVMYGLAMSRILNVLQHSLNNNQRCPNAGEQYNNIEFPMASFHDDLMIPVASDATNIVSITVAVVTTSIYVFNMFGLSLNFNANKSEAIVAFHGQDSCKARNQIAKDEWQAPFVNMNGNQCVLRFVHNYKHLGTNTSVSCDMADEVVLRSCVMSTDAKKLSKRIFKNPNVPSSGKIAVAKTYLFSKGCFNCGTWPKLSNIVFFKFHSSIMNIYRLATSSKRAGPSNISDFDLLTRHSLISPGNILRMSRILLYTRIVSKGVFSLLSIIHPMTALGSGWAHDLLCDLQWIAHFEQFTEIANKPIVFVYEHIRSNPKKFASSVRSLFSSPFLNMPLEKEEEGSTGPSLSVVPSFKCNICNIAMPSYQQLQLHIKSRHKVRNPINTYINTTYCPICLKEYHNRESVLNHIRYRSHECRKALLWSGPIISAEEAEELASLEAAANRKLYACARKRYYKTNPCIQLSGPLPLIYYYRFGHKSHNMTRNRGPNKNNKFSHFRSTIHNNKHGNWVFRSFFGDGDTTCEQEDPNNTVSNTTIGAQNTCALRLSYRVHRKQAPFALSDLYGVQEDMSLARQSRIRINTLRHTFNTCNSSKSINLNFKASTDPYTHSLDPLLPLSCMPSDVQRGFQEGASCDARLCCAEVFTDCNNKLSNTIGCCSVCNHGFINRCACTCVADSNLGNTMPSPASFNSSSEFKGPINLSNHNNHLNHGNHFLDNDQLDAFEFLEDEPSSSSHVPLDPVGSCVEFNACHVAPHEPDDEPSTGRNRKQKLYHNRPCIHTCIYIYVYIYISNSFVYATYNFLHMYSYFLYCEISHLFLSI